MARIATVVFIDFETTGLPSMESNTTRITEVSMIAVRREYILKQGELLRSKKTATLRPRVVNKMTLCLDPQKDISDGASSITGLTNELLQHQVPFNEQVFTMLDNFLNLLEKPVCLVAHNGHGFDFPILKNHLKQLNVHFSDDLLCADSMYGIYDISEGNEKINKGAGHSKNDGGDEPSDNNDNGTRKRKLAEPYRPGKKRRIFFENNPKPQLSYKVVDIHERMLPDRVAGSAPPDAHTAEGDCIMLLEIAVIMGDDFIEWLDENHGLFRDINPMTPGVPLGD